MAESVLGYLLTGLAFDDNLLGNCNIKHHIIFYLVSNILQIVSPLLNLSVLFAAFTVRLLEPGHLEES